jgi:hypothetical protein
MTPIPMMLVYVTGCGTWGLQPLHIYPYVTVEMLSGVAGQMIDIECL